MPIILIPNPEYNPFIPSALYTFYKHSNNPVNYLSDLSLPISTPSLVLAKSSGYTKHVEIVPAHPPAKIFYFKIEKLSFLPDAKIRPKVSLNEKLSA